VQDLSVRIGLIGRMLGYGELIIESAGTEGRTVFAGLPLSLSITVLRYLDKRKNDTSNATDIGNP
jgi:hypothetical protein